MLGKHSEIVARPELLCVYLLLMEVVGVVVKVGESGCPLLRWGDLRGGWEGGEGQ